MNQPGNRLRAFAARWCCPETMERVIDPLIADVQREHLEAVRIGRTWRSRWIQAAGSITFLKVIVICAWTELSTHERWTLDDRRSLTRAILISAVTAVVLTVLLVSRTAEDIPAVLVHPSRVRLLFLAPYPLVGGIVLGATLGIVLGLGGRALSRRLIAAAIGCALIGCAIVFVDLGWVAPAARVSYRMTIGDTDPNLNIGEVSLGALRRQIERVKRESASSPDGFTLALSFNYHSRVALSFAPLLFTLFSLMMAGCLRRRWLLGIVACAAFVVYGWLIMTVTPWDLQPWNGRWPASAAAWLPNTVIVALAACFGILSARRAAGRRPRAAS